MVPGLSGVHLGLQSYFVTKNMISDGIGLPEVLLPINHKNYNLQGKMINQVMEKNGKFASRLKRLFVSL